MVKFFPSIPPDLHAWILRQPVFFVASAPLTGKHINVSPKGLPASSLSLLSPTEAAYIDSTGSGNETISHVRENARCTVMLCSFDASPRILRLFCRADVVEWNESLFRGLIARMGLQDKCLDGIRAVVRLHVFKVQTSCGYGVPRLALTTNPKTNEPTPYLQDRSTLGHWASVAVSKNEMHDYQRDNNYDSLDGLPGLKSAMIDRGQSSWAVNAGIWLRRWRRETELLSTTLLSVVLTVLSMTKLRFTRFLCGLCIQNRDNYRSSGTTCSYVVYCMQAWSPSRRCISCRSESEPQVSAAELNRAVTPRLHRQKNRFRQPAWASARREDPRQAQWGRLEEALKFCLRFIPIHAVIARAKAPSTCSAEITSVWTSYLVHSLTLSVSEVEVRHNPAVSLAARSLVLHPHDVSPEEKAYSDRRQAALHRWATSPVNRFIGASGSASDRRHAMAEFARNYPQDPVDVIISDYMSEYNMAVAAARKVDQTSPSAAEAGLINVSGGPAYERSFLEALEPALEDIAKHKIKVAVNAGVTDPKALYDVVINMVKERGVDLKVAWISGDEVLPTIKESLAAGKSTFKNIYTGETLDSWSFEPIYAQAYLGGLGITAALTHGADIVLCGRVADASPVIGAACWWHNWSRSDLDQLANAFVAGHLIECSNYVCGGNFTGFKELENTVGDGWTNIGYPIAEISSEGQVIITKQSYSTGGAVTIDTCSSQLLYEIQGPIYFNSDVTAILSDIHFEQIGHNRVAVKGIKSALPPPTTKVGITARGGYQAEVTYFMVGLDIPAKARMLEAQIRRLLAPYSKNFTVFDFSTIGICPDDPKDQNSATATFRILAQAPRAEDLAPSKFVRQVIDNIMQSYPGATFHLELRPGFPKPVFEYYVTLLPQSEVNHQAHLPWLNRTVDIAPPTESKVWPAQQPTQPVTVQPADVLTDFGPTVRAPLGYVVHARSGDKGSDANCGFWVRHADEYAWLRSLLSTEKAQELLGKEWREDGMMSIERFELPHLHGVHFLFRNLLDRGVGVTRTVDFLGKNVAEYLRARWVDIPMKFLDRGKL
ncbi:hypothetical protein LOZ36_005452 [Ophidiomyces ophidiicola]|nr:hypothetical protein LOZ36_005452 [Ophidiomyces ophidiicola]